MTSSKKTARVAGRQRHTTTQQQVAPKTPTRDKRSQFDLVEKVFICVLLINQYSNTQHLAVVCFHINHETYLGA